MKKILLSACILSPILTHSQPGSISWPAACPTNNCPTVYTDANGVKVTVSSSYGTGTGAAVNLTQLQGTTGGPLTINGTSSAGTNTPGLGIVLNYGTNYADAKAGNMISIAFDKAISGSNFILYDITSPFISCTQTSNIGAIYNDNVVITGTATNGSTVQATLAKQSSGYFIGNAQGTASTYTAGSLPAYMKATQLSMAGNTAYVTGGYINNTNTSGQVNLTGMGGISLDLAVSFPVPVKEIQILYKNFSAASGDWFSYYKFNSVCPAGITTSNFAQGNINPQGIMVGNINYSDIILNLAGTVYNDPNGMTGGVNGTAMNGVTVGLYDATGTVFIATTTTDANGAYRFDVDPNTNYTIRVTPPAGYASASGTDATPADGSTTVSITSDHMTDINFGLNQPPVANDDNLSGQTPGQAATVTNILSNDSDPNGGTLVADSITLRPSSINVPGITYTTDAQGDTVSVTVPGQGTWTLNSSNANVTFTPATGFTADPTPIQYSVTDIAGLSSNPATITIDYNAPATISGMVHNDNNGQVSGPNGTALAGVSVTLYAANGTTVISTTTTDASGNYSFPGLVPANYVVGITAPSGYQNVSSTDGTPLDGKTALVLGSANVNGINFGLNQPPVANNDNLSGQTPGQAATVTNILSNDSDPNGGTLVADSITLRPLSINVPGITYTTDAQGDTVSVTIPGQGTWTLNSSNANVTFTPVTGFTADPTPIQYSVTDLAGLSSNPATITIGYSLPVPVVLHSFDGKAIGNCAVALNWQTAKEDAFAGFEIESSSDARTFNQIGEVAAKGNNSSYVFEYRNTLQGKNYFRLKLKDRDGYNSNSDVVTVYVDCVAKRSIKVYPNVISGEKVQIEGLQTGETIRVIDVRGKQLLNKAARQEKEQVDISSFTSGIYYILILTANNESLSFKVLKQ